MEHKEIHNICEKYNITNYTINDDGTIDVGSGVYLYHNGLRKLPLKFNYVSGNFDCSHNNLETLDGSPKKVGGNFDCSYNKLISPEGAPEKVSGYFNCSNNKLTTLEGSPKEVKGNFWCIDNKLTSLKGVPLEVDSFISYGNIVELDYNKYLKSIKRLNKLKQLV